MQSVKKLAGLVDIQNEYNSERQGAFLQIVKFMRVKMHPEVLHILTRDVLFELSSLTQLKLSGTNLNHTRVVAQLESCIIKHADELEMLDFEDSKLQPEHLAILSEQIKKCEYLLSLKLTDNVTQPQHPQMPTFIANLQEMIEN